MDLTQKLCLGTVGFGLDYGINNQEGKPTKEKVYNIMNYAINHGIKVFDTAAAYGNSEAVLGDYNKHSNCQDIQYISKLLPDKHEMEGDLTQVVVEEVGQSLIRLGVNKLDGYLLHNPEHLYEPRIMTGLIKAKEMGLVDHIGVSIYEPKHALKAAEEGIVDYIQIPYNVFDHRLNQTNFFEMIKTNHIKVFARSAFLQGLIMMDLDQVPAYVSEAKPYIEKYNDIAVRYGYNKAELAIKYVLEDNNIDYWVFSVDNMNQLEQNIQLSQTEPIKKACIEEIERTFKSVSQKVLQPNLWK